MPVEVASSTSVYKNARRKVLELFNVAEKELLKLESDREYRFKEFGVTSAIPSDAQARVVLNSTSRVEVIAAREQNAGTVLYIPGGVSVKSVSLSFAAYPLFSVELSGDFDSWFMSKITFTSLHYLLGFLYHTGDVYRLASGDIVSEEGDPAALSLIKVLSALMVRAEERGVLDYKTDGKQVVQRARIPLVEIGTIVDTRSFGKVYFALVKYSTKDEPDIHIEVYNGERRHNEFVTYCELRKKYLKRMDRTMRKFSLHLLTDSYTFSLLSTAVHRKLAPTVSSLLRGLFLADVAVSSYAELA